MALVQYRHFTDIMPDAAAKSRGLEERVFPLGSGYLLYLIENAPLQPSQRHLRVIGTIDDVRDWKYAHDTVPFRLHNISATVQLDVSRVSTIPERKRARRLEVTSYLHKAHGCVPIIFCDPEAALERY